MKWILAYLVTFGISIDNTNGQTSCSVYEVRSREQRYCQFPFVIGRKRYDSCTEDNDPEGKKWCSTRTYNDTLSLHVHVGNEGYWGYCKDDCLEKDVGPCDDYADHGFHCVPSDHCDSMCKVIADPSNPFTVKTSELGCESDKTCSGNNEVCCR